MTEEETSGVIEEDALWQG